ncbi:ArsC/Spx/MgsR family protein [Glaciimonas sp. PCH181]|uniref:ArsC/Spx/MgsR family protein n=1 Tax=Glaciimonas sp. PCH181 TaxID=2133943 RepID=UPI000D370B6F|nr:ArsC/Spx/MgsR family protein [Glaciimonas sp. PCH181]PUA17633.1 arsenate reductase (glutaredoxin) [Glaciimonas sp. PCH181]
MMTIFHNSRCSYSRKALYKVEAICAAKHLLMQIIDYQLTLPQLRSLQKKLGKSAAQIIRINDPKYRNLKLSEAKNTVILQAIVDYPHLLQRPIVVYQNRAVMAKPADLVETLF